MGVHAIMIKMNAVSTWYGSIPMLRSVDLIIAPGELVCVLGPNGAGKTTLFKAIAGLVKPGEGAVQIMGSSLAEIGTERVAALGVGFVPEGRRLFPLMTVAQNLRLGFDAVSPNGTDFAERMLEVGRIFPRVTERASQIAGTLSGGEQAMVALARALIGRPKVIIMDEPSLGLSPKLIDEYFEIVHRLHTEGTTILLIEQNAEMALRVASRGYVLSRGRIVATDDTASLRTSSIIRNLYFS